MSAVLQQPSMSLEDFLAWEELQPIRYEFDGMRATSMAGGSLAHSLIKANLVTALGIRLRGKPCRRYNSDAKVTVAGHIRYPDATITCTEQASAERSRQGVVNEPVVVFEVLSESTSLKDRNDKNIEYRATPSIRRYVMLEQERMSATVFERAGDDWVGHLLFGADAVLELPEVGIDSIPLPEFYEGVTLPEPSESDPG
jgi:Uma2 family endonuclease